AFLDVRRVPTALEDRELGLRHERVNLLGLVDGTDPVMSSDGHESRAREAWQLPAAVVRRVLSTDDEITHGDAGTRFCPRYEALGRAPRVEEGERADGFGR